MYLKKCLLLFFKKIISNFIPPSPSFSPSLLLSYTHTQIFFFKYPAQGLMVPQGPIQKQLSLLYSFYNSPNLHAWVCGKLPQQTLSDVPERIRKNNRWSKSKTPSVKMKAFELTVSELEWEFQFDPNPIYIFKSRNWAFPQNLASPRHVTPQHTASPYK